MTLVVAFVKGADVCVISDMMLTANKRDVGAQDSISFLPSKPKDTYVANQPHAFGQLTQKIRWVGDGIFLCWSGSLANADKLTNYMRLRLRNNPLLSAEELLSAYCGNVEGIGFIIVSQNEYSGFNVVGGHGSSNVITEEFSIEDDIRVFVLGSGVGDFRTWLSRVKFKAPNTSNLHKMVRIGISFMADSLLRQNTDDFGLAERWGGGFEVLINRGGELAKLDRVLMQCFDLVSTGVNRLKPVQVAHQTYHFYKDNDYYLHAHHVVVNQSTGTKNPEEAIHVVPDLGHEQVRVWPKIPPRPLWLIAPLRDAQSGEVGGSFFSEFPNGAPHVEYRLENGRIVWRQDPDELKRLFRKAFNGE